MSVCGIGETTLVGLVCGIGEIGEILIDGNNMGHADTRCTEYYLRLTAELYPGMVEQVERECGWVVPS